MSDLHAFAHDWYSAALAARAARDTGTAIDAAIATHLAPLITHREPHRADALRDADLLLQLPLLNGLGLRIRARDASEVPFEGWPRSIAPFVFDLAWQDTMDVSSGESMASSELARIGFEDGAWRVVAIFGDAERAQARRFAELFAQRRG